MAGALGLVLTGDTVPVEGRAAVPVYVDDSLPIVGPSRACVVVTSGPMAGGPAQPVRLAPAGTPAIGPALPVYVVPGGGSLGGGSVQTYTQKVQALSPIAYWALAEASGTTIVDESGNGRNGTYGATTKAPTLGATGIGDGRTAASFDGGDYGDALSASLTAAYTGGELTISFWAKMSAAGVWTDGGVRRAVELFNTSTNNELWIGKNSTNNQFIVNYAAGGTTRTQVFSSSTTAWFHVAVMISKTADQMKLFLNGVQQGSTVIALGTWSAGLTRAIIGAGNNTPVLAWSGTLAHVAILPVLSDSQIATLATV